MWIAFHHTCGSPANRLKESSGIGTTSNECRNLSAGSSSPVQRCDHVDSQTMSTSWVSTRRSSARTICGR